MGPRARRVEVDQKKKSRGCLALWRANGKWWSESREEKNGEQRLKRLAGYGKQSPEWSRGMNEKAQGRG